MNYLRVWVDGEVEVKASCPLTAGMKIEVGKREKAPKTPLKIYFEDRHLIVIEKPAGLLSVKTHYDTDNTAHALLKEYRKPSKVYPVQRLDRETSGVMVFALTEEARDGLKDQLEKRTVEREYLAAVAGTVSEEEGSWSSYLYEDANYVVHSTPDPKRGKLATTHFQVLERRKGYTLLSVRLETGRKNQIRVHASEAGHPILGDEKYGFSGKNPIKRLGLHATFLSFIHPITGKKLSFDSKWEV
jgi:tRNA pseudouridine32 synthase/23S rRNA pseudouridine746 synthase/23S rRNA pseudouridine1911/1915/1917 synthase